MEDPAPDRAAPGTTDGVVPEMISGPDLGAGFLYQLTIERLPDLARFTYHAQEGGVDASGPPKGNPEAFGWRRSPGMCPMGGHQCWHRDFWLPEGEAAGVRTAYNRTRFVMEASIEQAYGGRAVPVEATLDALLELGPGTGAGPTVRWWFGGAVALWVQGATLRPATVEIETTEPGVRAWADRLSEYLIEPPASTTWYGGVRRFGARAFVGTLREGTRVEWSDPGPGRPGFSPEEEERLRRPVGWKGHAIEARLPAWVLVRAAEEMRSDLVEAALPACAADLGSGAHLERLLSASSLTAAERDELLRRLGVHTPG